MRILTIITAAVALIVAASVFAQKPNTGATQASQTALSSFDLMSNAKDLPVAPNPDAF